MASLACVIVDSRPIKQSILDNHRLDGWEMIMFNEVRINNLMDYNRLLTNPSFWEHLLKYERILIFQQDSELLHKEIDQFLEWDLIGAPWKFQENGGNGGLSLRNPKICLDLLKQREWTITYGYEDVYFSNYLHEVGGKVAPRDVCSKFSCETIFQLGTFGAHAIDKHLSSKQCDQIRKWQSVASQTT